MYSSLGTFEGENLLPKNPHDVTKGESGFVPLEGLHFHMKREVLSNPFIHVCLVCCTQYQSSKRQ